VATASSLPLNGLAPAPTQGTTPTFEALSSQRGLIADCSWTAWAHRASRRAARDAWPRPPHRPGRRRCRSRWTASNA